MIGGGVLRSVVVERPGGAAQVHASSLLVLPGGEVLVACFAGTHEGSDDTRVVVSRSDRDQVRDGVRFGDPHVISPDARVAHWNPVLAAGPDGRVWLFFKRGPAIDTWRTFVCHSRDAGASWTPPAELVARDDTGGRGPVRHAPVTHGRWWVAPGSVEVWGEPPRWDCFVDLSADAGTTWRRVALPLDHARVRGAGCIQPALVITGDGRLVALTRSTGGAVHATSTRDPQIWPPLRPVGLGNNNSGLAAVTLPDGRLACVHNPSSDDWGARCPLVVSVSGDAGETWTLAATLEDGSGLAALADAGDQVARDAVAVTTAPPDGRPSGASASGVVTDGRGEYSYPSAAVVGDELWVTYSWQRRAIVLARLPLAALAAPPSGTFSTHTTG